MNLYLYGVFLLFALFIISAGCTESPLKEPTITVDDIALSDVSLKTMTVNTTVTIHNPNPIGATLNKVVFDLTYTDDTVHYLGHGEQANIVVKENGNTTFTIPVKIDTVPALQATGSLVQKGSLMLKVNGSAFLDIKVTSYELPFERSREFKSSEFTNILPEISLAGTSINVTEGLAQARGILDALSG
jgi:LEA14-like dessication related protein